MRIALISGMLLLLSACGMTGGHLAELRAQKPVGEDFSHALASEYLAYAEARSEDGHPLRAEYFAGKGLAALQGRQVDPEERGALTESRQALLAVLTPDMKEIAPIRAARAQLLFDCWVEKETVCKEGFVEALADIQFIADALVQEDENRFSVPFAAGSAALNPQASGLLEIVAKRVSGLGRYQVELVPADLKNKLTARRLLAIEQGLILRGVDAGRIHSHRKAKDRAVLLSRDEAAEDRQAVWISIQTYGQVPEAITP